MGIVIAILMYLGIILSPNTPDFVKDQADDSRKIIVIEDVEDM